MTETTGPRIALIHALAESLAPIHAAFAELWPEAAIFDLFDSSLAPDRALAGACDAAMVRRFQTLADYATESEGVGGQAGAILFTCSAFGPAIDAVQQRQAMPVLKPNEAAFAEALRHGRRIGLCVTFPPSLQSLADELRQMAEAQAQSIEITPILVEGAMAALKAGDGVRHDLLVRQSCSELPDLDALVLGQFSLARAAVPLGQDHSVPIITTPHSAVRALKVRMTTPHSQNARK